MSRELLKYPKIQDYTLTWMDYLRDGATQLVNTNKLIRSYQGITGLKTGTTSQAGSCITATAVTVPESPALEPAPVTGGMENTVALQVGESPKLLMKAGESQNVQQSVQIREGISAPIQKGDVLGKVVYSAGGSVLAEVPITAGASVEAITFGSAFRYLLQGFFTF